MPDQTKLNQEAHREKVCVDCGGSGGAFTGTSYGGLSEQVACDTCNGTGKVYKWGDGVRKPCRRAKMVGLPCPDNCQEEEFHFHTGPVHQPDCKACGGRATIGSNRMEDWLDAAAELGTPFNLRKEGDTWYVWYEDIFAKRGESPDIITALLAAVEKIDA